MRKISIKDKVLKIVGIPLAIIIKLEKKEAYERNRKPKDLRKEVCA
jgi:hypothetical protein